MKTLPKFGLAALALLGAAGAVVWQRVQVMQLQDERAQLAAAQEEAIGLAEQARDLDKLRALLPEAEKLKAANRDLLSLRNQVRQLREAGAEMEKLRAVTQRLAAQLQGPVVVPKSITEMEGFVAKESWVRGGSDTPEAAVQNFFWAIREGDVEAFAACLPLDEQEGLRQKKGKAGLDEVQRGMEEMRAMAARLKGYRVASKTESGEGKVVLGLQVAAGGDLVKIHLERVGQEWRIREFR
jgi:hypothetical protein